MKSRRQRRFNGAGNIGLAENENAARSSAHGRAFSRRAERRQRRGNFASWRLSHCDWRTQHKLTRRDNVPSHSIRGDKSYDISRKPDVKIRAMILHLKYIAKSLGNFGLIFIQTVDVFRHGKTGADPSSMTVSVSATAPLTCTAPRDVPASYPALPFAATSVAAGFGRCRTRSQGRTALGMLLQ